MSRTCGVLGHPIAHSLSPTLHRAGYAALGLGWTYDAHDVDAGGLRGFLAGLDPSWRGLSLTMPLKREAFQVVDGVSDAARLSGAVNTLVLDDGAVLGANTDIPGAVAAISERTQRSLSRGVILGGGATATSTGLALCDLGVDDIRVAVREPARAAETVAAIAAHPSGPRVSVESLSGPEPFEADIVVATVPASAQGSALVQRCAEIPVVFEVIYDPWPTPLASAALADGRDLVGGLDLLVHQAVLQFELFTSQPGPLAVMRAAGETALAQRGEI